ncbi:hypothetical protein BD626DRAFT_475976 [Schizophyllum amplum]|uniref:Uncharacterized protein n=1 Tax=Schizophyllum amplum TaxID=97359 RepID=A0A550CYX3_9AGAR|nr:hypothetical protein BD626DRAFT_475976 [Auriculariopsis ampla]
MDTVHRSRFGHREQRTNAVIAGCQRGCWSPCWQEMTTVEGKMVTACGGRAPQYMVDVL